MSKEFKLIKKQKNLIKVITDLILTRVEDSRIKDNKPMITRIKLTSNLEFADIYYTLSLSNRGKIKQTQEGFESAKGFFKKYISLSLKSKITPNLRFYYDDDYDNMIEVLKNKG